MNKAIFLLLFSVTTLFSYSQAPELIYSESNLFLRTVTADSSNYYYFDAYYSTLNSLDALGNKTELTTVPDVSASFQDVMVCNKGKCIFGNSTSSGTFYFLYNGISIDTLYESNAQMVFDRVIAGDFVYYHDTKSVYYTDLSSVDNFQILHEAPGATDFTGISDFFRLDNKIFFKEADFINGGSRLKVIDMNTNVVSDLSGGTGSQNFNLSKAPNSVIMIVDPYSSGAVVWEVGSNLGFEKLYDGMVNGFQFAVNKYLGKLNNEILLEGSKGGIPCLLKTNGSSLTPLNHGTDQNSYPTLVQSFYQAGDYIYFMASDTNYLNNNFQQKALWVTDGTLNGTRKMIPYSSPNLPQSFNMFETTNKPNVNCYNDLWIGFNSDKLLHVNAETNLIESFSDVKNATGFYPVLNNDFVLFSAKNENNQFQIKKIACSGNLEIVEKESNDFSVYPNPAGDGFNIEFAKEFSGAIITISDPTGKIVLKETLNEKQHFFTISDFKSGVYIINIKDKNASISKLLIKE